MGLRAHPSEHFMTYILISKFVPPCSLVCVKASPNAFFRVCAVRGTRTISEPGRRLAAASAAADSKSTQPLERTQRSAFASATRRNPHRGIHVCMSHESVQRHMCVICTVRESRITSHGRQALSVPLAATPTMASMHA